MRRRASSPLTVHPRSGRAPRGWGPRDLTRLGCRCALSFALVASGILPLATEARAEISERIRVAREDVQAGARLFKDGRYAEALARFLAASRVGADIGDEAGLWFNIARCLEEMGEHRKAISAFEKYLTFPGESAQTRQRAQRKIKSLETLAFAQLTVECAPGVEIALPGGPAAQPCPVTWRRLSPGVVTVKARDAKAGLDWPVPIELSAGDALHTRILPPGRLTVRGLRPDDRIFVDGAESASTGEAQVVAAPGRHTVRIESVGHPVWQVEAEVISDTITLVSPQPEGPAPAPGAPAWLPWTASGVSALCLGGAVIAHLRAAEMFDDARAAHDRFNASSDPVVRATQKRRADDALSAGRDSRTLSWILGGAGVAFAGAAIWLWLDDEPDEDDNGGLAISPTGALIVWGRF